jgi:autophagy-related protein 11
MLIGLMRVLSDMEQSVQNKEDEIALKSIRDCKAGLEKQIAKMDSLEAGFDKIAERSREYLCHNCYLVTD